MVGGQREILNRIDTNVAKINDRPADDLYFSGALIQDIRNNLGEDPREVDWSDRFGDDLRENHRFTPSNMNLMVSFVFFIM